MFLSCYVLGLGFRVESLVRSARQDALVRVFKWSRDKNGYKVDLPSTCCKGSISNLIWLMI